MLQSQRTCKRPSATHSCHVLMKHIHQIQGLVQKKSKIWQQAQAQLCCLWIIPLQPLQRDCNCLMCLYSWWKRSHGSLMMRGWKYACLEYMGKKFQMWMDLVVHSNGWNSMYMHTKLLSHEHYENNHMVLLDKWTFASLFALCSSLLLSFHRFIISPIIV